MKAERPQEEVSSEMELTIFQEEIGGLFGGYHKEARTKR
jgi:hypothetical protein